MFPKSFLIYAENALSYLLDLDRFKNIIYEKFQVWLSPSKKIMLFAL